MTKPSWNPDQETRKHSEPTLDDIAPNAHDDAPDGLALLIQDAIDTRPGFRDEWEPFAVIGNLIDQRLRLGYSQADVAGRMGVDRTVVAKLENDPSGVSFARIMAYARALGARIEVKPSTLAPVAQKEGRGRKVAFKEGSGRTVASKNSPRGVVIDGTTSTVRVGDVHPGRKK